MFVCELRAGNKQHWWRQKGARERGVAQGMTVLRPVHCNGQETKPGKGLLETRQKEIGKRERDATAGAANS